MVRGMFGRHGAAGVVLCGLVVTFGIGWGAQPISQDEGSWATAPPLAPEAAAAAWRDRVKAGAYATWLESDRNDGEKGVVNAALVGVPVLRVLPGAGNGDGPENAGSGWAGAFDTLEEALAAGQQLDGPVQVWVASGVYIPGGPGGSRSDSFVLFNGLELLGGFAGDEDSADQRDPIANPTVLSGNRGSPLTSDDNNFHVVRFEGFSQAAIIDGFIIRDGNANGSGDDRFGGGLFAKNASVTVRNCLFTENNASKGGGGMHTTGGSATVVVENSVFANNAGETGGGLCLNSGGTVRNTSFFNNNGVFGGGLGGSGTIVVDNAAFQNNFAIEGGGVTSQAGTLRMKWATFRNNSAQRGGGVRITGGNNHIISNSRIMLGTANEGAGISTTGPCSIVNSLIAWNNAFAIGGGVHMSLAPNATVQLLHSTLWQNSASQNGGGVFVGTGGIAIANSVLYKNSSFGASTTLDAQVFASNFGTRTARYSCIEGIAAPSAPTLGPQNFADPPQFVDPLGPDNLPGTGDEDFTPGPSSPLLDRAEDASIPQDVLDLDSDGNTSELIPLDLLGQQRFAAAPGIPVPFPGSALRADVGPIEAPDPTKPICLGDLNGDGVVDADDLAIMLGLFGTFSNNAIADLDGNGAVDADDLSIFLGLFGSSC